MNAQVLVLDGAFQPVSSIKWELAMKLLFTEKVEVVKFYNNKIVRSAKQNWKVPAVVKIITGYLLSNKKKVRFSRENVYARDDYTCQYCNLKFEKFQTKKMTWDHVLPRSKGGVTKWDNITTACFDCNQKKGDRTPDESGMFPKRQPVKPTNLPIVYSWLKDSIPAEWLEVVEWFK